MPYYNKFPRPDKFNVSIGDFIVVSPGDSKSNGYQLMPIVEIREKEAVGRDCNGLCPMPYREIIVVKIYDGKCLVGESVKIGKDSLTSRLLRNMIANGRINAGEINGSGI